MKIYVVICEPDHDYYEIVGATDTRSAAEELTEAHKRSCIMVNRFPLYPPKDRHKFPLVYITETILQEVTK